MNHLESLVAEYLEWSGYFVRRSIRVGALAKGGYEGELDVVGWHPTTNHRIHVECSLDAYSWSKREERYARKFEIGQKYIGAVFPGTLALDQVVVLTFAGKNADDHRVVGGGRLVTTRELTAEIIQSLANTNPVSSATPEQYPMLRTIQLVEWSQGSPAGKLIP
ncbi:MAG: hypothetical protein H8E30_14505 [Alphaproteobacteria bacterium]|nr:hypothetical protein [Alphaproteobacteria bacterium]